MPWPKSLANDFGADVIFPMAAKGGYSIQDGLRTFVEHMAQQLKASLATLLEGQTGNKRILITGGGAHNSFVVERLTALLQEIDVEVVVPDKVLVDFKEASHHGIDRRTALARRDQRDVQCNGCRQGQHRWRRMDGPALELRLFSNDNKYPHRIQPLCGYFVL